MVESLEVRVLSLIQQNENNSQMEFLNILKKGERVFFNTKEGRQLLLVSDIDFIKGRYLLLNENSHQIHNISFELYLDYLQCVKYKLLNCDE